MNQIKRRAPDPEWVQMYRQGIPTPKIAAGAGVAETTVRYHMALAAKQDPGLRAEHQAALPPVVPRPTAVGQRNLEEILALYREEGRLPTRHTRRERALATWLGRRREEAANGTLSRAYGDALSTIPDWGAPSKKKASDEARWKQRLGEVGAYLRAGNEWPRHNKTKDQVERKLGVWLHTQRINYRAGKLTTFKEAQLDGVIPGWRQGRPGRGAKRRRSDVIKPADKMAASSGAFSRTATSEAWGAVRQCTAGSTPQLQAGPSTREE